MTKRRRGIYLLPNLFTTSALFAGFYAIVAAINARYEPAAIAIFVAMILDGMDGLEALFNTKAGQAHLAERAGVPVETVAQLRHFGLSSIANMLAAIKLARHLGLGRDDVLLTVATDGAELYESERARYLAQLPEGLDARAAAEIHATHLQAITTDHLLETTATDRRRIFNLGYFTWVEQQGIALEDFDARREQTFWRDLQALVPVWDELIAAFNRETRAAAA